MKRVQPTQPRQRQGRSVARGHAATLLAVYGGPARPGRELRLRIAGHPATRAELSFRPLVRHKEGDCCIGLLQNRSGYRLRAPRFEVVPEGSRQASPTELEVAGKLPKRVAASPGPVLKGFAKSVLQAFLDLGEVGTETGRWRAALILALDGEIAPDKLGLGDAGEHSAALVMHEGRLVWRGFVERLASKLQEQARRLVQRNPFADGLSVSAAAALLETGNLRMARLVLEQAARELEWRESSLFGEPRYVLAADDQAAATDADREAAAEALKAVERGDGGLAKLREKYRSSPHLIPWLLEAGWLVCSADGFVFTRDELYRYWNELGLEPGAGPPGVGELKERLRLSRRKAEGLRRLLADRPGVPGSAADAREGQ